MKTNFTAVVIGAAYFAINAQGQNLLRFLDDTCEVEAYARMKIFDAQIKYRQDGEFISEQLYIKGRDERALCTEEDQIEIGFDNHAWVIERNNATTASTYKPNYLNGTLYFDVDVSDVGCNCAAGVNLIALESDNCHQGEYDESSSLPKCPQIDVMKANQLGFKTAITPCEDPDSCSPSYCKSNNFAPGEYGPGPSYTINTLEPYQVVTSFLADHYNNHVKISTSLYQGSKAIFIPSYGRDCGDCEFMSSQLKNNMTMAISTYSLGTDTNPLTDQCTQVCNSGSTIISGLKWIERPEITIVWGEAAPSLTSGQCASTNCSECRLSWYDDDLTNSEYRCKDETVYSYGNMCNSERLNTEGKDLCMTEEKYCHWSWPADDTLGNKSEKAACRSIPQDYYKGDWKFDKRPSPWNKNGLCEYGCEEYGGTCSWSWPKGEEHANNPKAMHRCNIPN